MEKDQRMASVSFISTEKLISLLAEADPRKDLLVRVIDATRLSLETRSFQMVATIDLANEKVIGATSNETSTPIIVQKISRKSGKYFFDFFGQTREVNSLKELLAEGLLALENACPGTIEKLSQVKKNTKRIVSRLPSDLFDTPGLSEKYSQKLSDGWWFGTNNSAQETKAWLERACNCANVTWGKDFSTSV